MTEPEHRHPSCLSDLEVLVGKNLRKAREDAERTQQNVADVLSQGRGAISDIERGRRKLTAGELALVCEYLQVDPVSLFRESGYEHQLYALASQGVANYVARLPSPRA